MKSRTLRVYTEISERNQRLAYYVDETSLLTREIPSGENSPSLSTVTHRGRWIYTYTAAGVSANCELSVSVIA